MLLLWHCLTAALPTMNCLQHWSLDTARQKQQAAILENEGISRQVRALATQIHGGHLLHWQKVIDSVCLPRLPLCLFQVTPDLEVLSPSRERMGARKGCCLQACLERATLVASGCWQRVSYKPCPSLPSADKCFPLLSSPLAEHRQLYVMYALLYRALCSDYGALVSSEGRDEDFTGICNKNQLKAIRGRRC